MSHEPMNKIYRSSQKFNISTQTNINDESGNAITYEVFEQIVQLIA